MLAARRRNYHGLGNVYLITYQKFQIVIGIGKFLYLVEEELQIGNSLGQIPEGG